MTLISLLVVVAVFCVVAYLINYLTSLPGVPPPVRVVAYVVLCLVAIIWLLQFLPGVHFGRLG